MTGASRLAALAAQRAGSGIVVVAVSKNSENIYYSSLTSQIIKSYRNLKEFRSILDDPRINSIVIGPGLGQGKKTISKMKIIFERKRRAVIDAEAISSFKNNIDLLKEITNGSEIVYTPHEGELLKLFPNLKGNAIEKSVYAANNLNSTLSAAERKKSRPSLSSFTPKWVTVSKYVIPVNMAFQMKNE